MKEKSWLGRFCFQKVNKVISFRVFFLLMMVYMNGCVQRNPTRFARIQKICMNIQKKKFKKQNFVNLSYANRQKGACHKVFAEQNFQVVTKHEEY